MTERAPSSTSKIGCAKIVYVDGAPRIFCEEQLCLHYEEGNCKNPNPVINDNCPLDQFCESFEPLDIDTHFISLGRND